MFFRKKTCVYIIKFLGSEYAVPKAILHFGRAARGTEKFTTREEQDSPLSGGKPG
jgi:hypothetical protein